MKSVRQQLRNLGLVSHELSVNCDSHTVQPSRSVRDLGIQLGDELSMVQHVSSVTRTCFYHIRRLRQIRRYVGEDAAVQLVLALVTSRLDYCNSILAGLPATTTAPLQRVQNAAARLVFNLRPRDHVTPALLQLHWLPIQARITFKLCVLMFQAHSGLLPSYLSQTLSSCQTSVRRPGLRSESSHDYILPRLRTKFGERPFSYAGPHAWNSLPPSVLLRNN